VSPSPSRLRFVDHVADDVLLWVTDPDPDAQLQTTRAMWAGQLRDLISADLVKRTGHGIADIVATDKGDARAKEIRAHRERTGEAAA
jgi:hypothetical protein